MKTHVNPYFMPNMTKISLLILILIGVFSSIIAQPIPLQDDGSKKYRVTAYKIASTTLTSLSNVAEAIPKPTMYIPSAFTPNGDGVNDFFGVKAEGLKAFKLEIYNRWGEVVFASDDIYDLWDGTYLGKTITSTDVFVYQVKAIGKNNEPLPEEKGTVTLIADGNAE